MHEDPIAHGTSSNVCSFSTYGVHALRAISEMVAMLMAACPFPILNFGLRSYLSKVPLTVVLTLAGVTILASC